MDEKADLSKWLNKAATKCSMDIVLDGVPAGTYLWAVGLVDITRETSGGMHEIGLNLSATKDFLTDDGWCKVTEVTVGEAEL